MAIKEKMKEIKEGHKKEAFLAFFLLNANAVILQTLRKLFSLFFSQSLFSHTSSELRLRGEDESSGNWIRS